MRMTYLLAFVLAVSCASVKKAPIEQDKQAKEFKRPTEQAGLYIYRNQFLRPNEGVNIFLNGKLFAKTGAHTYVYKQLPAGKYTLKTEYDGDVSSVEIELSEGENSFVWHQVTIEGLMFSRYRLLPVHKDEGRQGVIQSERILSEF